MSYLNDVDFEKVEKLLSETSENVKYFESVSNTVVESYTKSLDDIMKNLYKDVIMNDNPPMQILEKYFLELTNALYFMGEKLEHLGVYDDMSKAAAKEVYNKAYLNNQVTDNGKKPTVAENQSVAENASVYETSVNSIYNRAYKIFKYKIDAGYEMIKTLSKIISRRMSEQSLTTAADFLSSGRQTLNEGV